MLNPDTYELPYDPSTYHIISDSRHATFTVDQVSLTEYTLYTCSLLIQLLTLFTHYNVIMLCKPMLKELHSI